MDLDLDLAVHVYPAFFPLISVWEYWSVDVFYSAAYTFIVIWRAIPATKLLATSSYKLGFYRYGWESRTFRNITADSIYIMIQGWLSMTQLLLEHSWKSHYKYETYRANSLCEHVTQHVLLEPSPSECWVTSPNRNPLDGAPSTGPKRKEYGWRKELISSMLSGIWKSRCLSVLVSLGVPELLCNSVGPVSIQEIAERTGCHTGEKVYKVWEPWLSGELERNWARNTSRPIEPWSCWGETKDGVLAIWLDTTTFLRVMCSQLLHELYLVFNQLYYCHGSNVLKESLLEKSIITWNKEEIRGK